MKRGVSDFEPRTAKSSYPAAIGDRMEFLVPLSKIGITGMPRCSAVLISMRKMSLGSSIRRLPWSSEISSHLGPPLTNELYSTDWRLTGPKNVPLVGVPTEGSGLRYADAGFTSTGEQALGNRTPAGRRQRTFVGQGGAIWRQQLPKPFLIRRRLVRFWRQTARLTHWTTLRAKKHGCCLHLQPLSLCQRGDRPHGFGRSRAVVGIA